MFAVCATFIIKPGEIENFIEVIKINAAQSLEHEMGCSRFDICQDNANPSEIFLYEVYDDADAFEVHKTMPHYSAFGAASGHMVEEKSVKTCTILNAPTR